MKAFYAGSFDPITNGHIDLIQQAVDVFDGVVIGIAVNPGKVNLFDLTQRYELVVASLKEIGIDDNCEVLPYDGLTVTFAKNVECDILIRGLRAVSDFDGEFQMTQFNRRLPPGRNTVFLMPDERNFYLSSTAIRGIASMGGDVSAFVPHCVLRALQKKFDAVYKEG